jgi:hypothetical protein
MTTCAPAVAGFGAAFTLRAEAQNLPEQQLGATFTSGHTIARGGAAMAGPDANVAAEAGARADNSKTSTRRMALLRISQTTFRRPEPARPG